MSIFALRRPRPFTAKAWCCAFSIDGTSHSTSTPWGSTETCKIFCAKRIDRPHGIVLVTGPTGSGKTTTLYALLKEINTPEKKIITIEDPVEYMLEGLNQVPLRPSIGLTFAQALRAFLRQDPDILMVGEIRDRETAEIAVQAALTGHLLFSTLHTNSAAGAVTRLLDMGIDDYLLTSTLANRARAATCSQALRRAVA